MFPRYEQSRSSKQRPRMIVALRLYYSEEAIIVIIRSFSLIPLIPFLFTMFLSWDFFFC